MRLFSTLAAFVLFIHLVWILWVLFGWLLTRHRPILTSIHIASLVWGVCVEAGPWPCPLTLVEQWLESRAGSGSYQGGFMVHYLDAIVYPDVSAQLLAWIGSGVCVAILAIYAVRFWRWYRARRTTA